MPPGKVQGNNLSKGADCSLSGHDLRRLPSHSSTGLSSKFILTPENCAYNSNQG